MKWLLSLLALITLIFSSGCVFREGRGGDWDDYHRSHGYGHDDHWEHHDRDWH